MKVFAPIFHFMAICAGLIILISQGSESQAGAHDFSVEAGITLQQLSGGASYIYPLQPGFQIGFSRKFGPRIDGLIEFVSGNVYTDSTKTSRYSFGSKSENRVETFQTRRLMLSFRYWITNPERNISPFVRAGIGFDSWKKLDGAGSQVILTTGINDNPTPFKTEELILGLGIGVDFKLTDHVGAIVDFRGARYTGAGAEFKPEVEEGRAQSLFAIGARLRYSFGGGEERDEWKMERSWNVTESSRASVIPESTRDSDGDGVIDDRDRCKLTPRGAEVDTRGCPLDEDADGVYDGLDDCPNTPSTAGGSVDIHGCPIDTDFDGVPDYADRCPDGPVGALVDAGGCPVDSDNDGVPDGLDNCPSVGEGIVVDQHGCPDMTPLHQPMILHIDYEPGSYEIDTRTSQKLKELAKLLQVTPAVTLRVIGYTDDIGPSEVNKLLSEKRARRVRDFLVRKGVDQARIKAMGRGETNFLADNSTRVGRKKNRRVEISFDFQ
ncbi:MAG: OmpA family protein [candidate division Zixibacteria bacterium]|nr:OmpA family protein [candidate division Zixibacteria bacterium]